jgi:hypothetical protein
MSATHPDPIHEEDTRPPGPEEHPGEIGPMLDAERTRLKTRHRERVERDEQPPPGKEPAEHQR